MPPIRDCRNGKFLWMQNSVMDEYGPKIGAYGIALYAVLARYASKDGHAWPSLRTMSKTLGINIGTVRRYLDLLASHGLIQRQKRKTEYGDNASTEYLLVDIPDIPQGGVLPGNTPVLVGDTPVLPKDIGVCYPVTQGVLPSSTEQDLLNKTYLEQEDPPLIPPGGKVRKPQRHALTEEARTVLAHLNTVTGRRYETGELIEARLRSGATVEQCCLVIDWWRGSKILQSPNQDAHFDNETPFRPTKFDKYRAAAEAWVAQGRRQASTTTQPSQRKLVL